MEGISHCLRLCNTLPQARLKVASERANTEGRPLHAAVFDHRVRRGRDVLDGRETEIPELPAPQHLIQGAEQSSQHAFGPRHGPWLYFIRSKTNKAVLKRGLPFDERSMTLLSTTAGLTLRECGASLSGGPTHRKACTYIWQTNAEIGKSLQAKIWLYFQTNIN